MCAKTATDSRESTKRSSVATNNSSITITINNSSSSF